jgi:tRNA threonylcarbamoyladenosine modification (KEOPS) complex  Pcc1 subunit
MSTCAKASVNLKFKTEKQLLTILSALQPETKALTTKRASVQLQKSGAELTLKVTADDSVALRATLNSFLHWIQSMLKVIDAVERA